MANIKVPRSAFWGAPLFLLIVGVLGGVEGVAAPMSWTVVNATDDAEITFQGKLILFGSGQSVSMSIQERDL